MGVLAVLALLAPLSANQPELVVMAEESVLDSWPVLEELAAEFEREHSCRVRLRGLGGAAGGQDKGKFLLAGDLPLDVLRIDVTELAGFAAEGALLDLEPWFDADPTWDESQYYPAVLEALRDQQGHLFGLPSTFTPYVMYANRDLLAASGVDWPRPDWTWEDLLEDCRRITRDTDGDGRTDVWGISLTQWLQAVAPWIWQAGGEFLDASGQHSGLASPQSVRALSFLHSLLFEERVASFDATFQGQLEQGLFQAGRTGFYGPVGYWETYRFRNLETFEWDVLPLPRDAHAATSVAMTAYVVPRTARHPELAYRFVRLLAGPRYQATLARIGNGVPGLVAVAESESFLKPGVPPDSEHVFLDVMGEARFLPPLANWRRIESLVAADLSEVLLVSRTDVPAACARMAARIDRYLAGERHRAERTRLPPGVMEAAVALALLGLVGLWWARRGPARPLLAREERGGLMLIAPWAVGFAAFLLGPAAVSLVLSFCEWSPLRPLGDARFAGLDNWVRLGRDPTFRASLGATAAYAAASVPLGLALALALALLLESDTRLAALVRTLCYVPAVVAPVIAGALWRWVLDDDRGLLNGWLRSLGLAAPAWLRDPDWVLPAFVLMSLWSVGAQMLVFLAALKARDPTLTEAARIDGAGPWQRFVHVILPQLSPVVLFNLITGTVAAFQIFAQAYVMTGGGPGDSSRFLVLYLYEAGFRHLDMGYASAIAWALFAILAVLSALFLVSSPRWVHYAARREA